MSLRSWRVGAIGTVVCAVAVVSAQAPPQSANPQDAQKPPVFRTSANVVPLTVTVLDRQNRPVTDLKQSDFTISENGRPREILNFYPQSFAARPPDATTPGAVNRAVRTDPLTPATRRVFVLVLGHGRIQYPTRALDGAMTFVRENLLPQDLVAVVAFDRATDLTGDHASIERLLARYKRDHERIVFEIQEFRLFNPRTPLPDWIWAEIEAVFTGQPTGRRGGPPATAADAVPGASRSATDLLLGLNRRTNAVERPDRRSQTLADFERESYLLDVPPAELVMGSSLLKLLAATEYVRDLDGERHVVFLGERARLGRQDENDKVDEDRLTRRMNDARVVLHIVKTDGVEPVNMGRGRTDLGPLSGLQSMQRTAALTGGYYTSVNYADKALNTIDQAARFSYLLGYAPVNSTLDGKYRTIDVQVNRRDVTVRFRHGYYAVDEPTPIELKSIITRARLEAAAAFATPATSIKVTATATHRRGLTLLGQLNVEISIDASKLALTAAGSVHTGELAIDVHAADEKQQILGSVSDRLEIKATPEQIAQYMKTGIPYSVRVPVAGTPRFVKVVVFDYGSDRTGTFTITMK